MAQQEQQREQQGQDATERNESGPESSRQAKNISRAAEATPARYGAWENRRGPFSLMRRLSDDMDRFLDEFFAGGRDWLDFPRSRWPQIEVSEQGNRIVVQADVPGLKMQNSVASC